MNMRRSSPAALLLILGAAVGVPITGAAASEAGMAAAEQVSEASYRDFLDNWLYTHAGDNRGFGVEHDLARDNIEMFFLLYGFDVELHPFQYQSTTYYNVVATMTGTVHPDQEYIVGAHYDSADNPGADDDGSGTAALLEIARIVSQYESAYTIRIIAFDREEQGLVGSNAYVADVAGADILGMVQADMIAYNTGANSTDIYAGSSGSTDLQVTLIGAVNEYGDGLTPVQASNPPGGSDHQPFANAGYQAVLIIEDWGNPYYHTQQDNVDVPGYIDYAYAARMTRSVVGWLVDAAEVDAARRDTGVRRSRRWHKDPGRGPRPGHRGPGSRDRPAVLRRRRRMGERAHGSRVAERLRRSSPLDRLPRRRPVLLQRRLPHRHDLHLAEERPRRSLLVARRLRNRGVLQRGL